MVKNEKNSRNRKNKNHWYQAMYGQNWTKIMIKSMPVRRVEIYN